MKSDNINFRALPCYNSKVYNQKVPGGIVSYMLFEKPDSGHKLPELCAPNCAKERICKYMLKDFIKGWVESVMYAQKNKDPFDVNFLLAQNGLYYGKVPKVKKESNDDNSSKNNDKEENKEKKMFITLAYPKAHSPESILDAGMPKKITDKVLAVKNKQMMVHFGKFLINMYKGLDNSTDIPPPTMDESFNPAGLNFKNLTAVFLNLNKEKDGNYSHFRAEPYFGVKSEYLPAVQAFLEKTLTTQKAFKEMDDELKGSFYEFVFKSVEFDVDNKKQFADFKAMLDHPFLKKQPEIKMMKSDTEFS